MEEVIGSLKVIERNESYAICKLSPAESIVSGVLGQYIVVDTFYEDEPKISNICYTGTSLPDCRLWIKNHI